MRYTSALVALASSTLALPTISKRADELQAAPLCEQFTVAFELNGTYLSANAVKNGTNIILRGEDMSVYPGTNAYRNASNPDPDQFHYSALDFVLEDGVYGASAADVGDNYGVEVEIGLDKNYQQFEWGFNNGSIYHKMAAAPNNFYACNGTLNGEHGIFLSWGDEAESPVLGPPAGCYFTRVIQNLNVPGGLQTYS